MATKVVKVIEKMAGNLAELKKHEYKNRLIWENLLDLKKCEENIFRI